MKTHFSLLKAAFSLLITGLLFTALSSCDDDNGGGSVVPDASTGTQFLVANNWKVSRVTTTDGQLITPGRLGTTTQILFDLNFQFRNNGTVRAIVSANQNIPNAGTWEWVDNNQAIDVKVQGFSGKFPVIKLEQNTILILRQRAPVDGTETDVNLEFVPAL